MAWGKIYDTTWWGRPTETGWGSIYFGLNQQEVLDEQGQYLYTENNEKIIIE